LENEIKLGHKRNCCPWIEPCLITDSILKELEDVFLDRISFKYKLKVGWFGDEVLILVPEDESNFISMTKAILNYWPDYPYYGGEYNKIEPHITLAIGEPIILKQIYKDIENLLPKEILCSKVDLNIGTPGNMKLLKTFNFKSS